MRRALALSLALLTAALAAPALAQERPLPEPVGDLAFVDSTRHAIETRLGFTFASADLNTGSNLHREMYGLHFMGDWTFGIAGIGDGGGIILPMRVNLETGYIDVEYDADIPLALGLDGAIGAGYRQDLAIETYVQAWIGYRFTLHTLPTYPTNEDFAAMWHLAYLNARFRHELFAVEAGAGYGAGGGHFHAGARLWLFDDIWFGADIEGFFTPASDDPTAGQLGRDLWLLKAFFALRAE